MNKIVTKKINFMTTLFVSFFTYPLVAQNFLESNLSHGTTALGDHHFLFNPSKYKSETLEMSLWMWRDKSSYIYKEIGPGANLDEQSNEINSENIAISTFIDMGSGLNIGINYQILKQEEKNQDIDRGQTEFIETFENRYTSLKATVELSEQITAGFQIRFLDSSHEIIGSFGLSPETTTVFKPSMFGSGGGIHGQFNNMEIGAVYIPPMKGKADILSEEKIITEPGLMELSAASVQNNFSIGLSLRRFLYKKDDRGAGTTLNDNNSTQINLYGLSVDRQLIFPREQIQIGVDIPLSNANTLSLSIDQRSHEFNPSIEDVLPGELDDNHIMKYKTLKALVRIIHKNLRLFIGLSQSYKKEDTHLSNNQTIEYKGSMLSSTFGVSAKL